jgi:2-dehydro-3-deoxyphosphooctonate aldolase (KDO 8-P synthase)
MVRIIGGPCQHESVEQSLKIARECKRVCDLYDFEYIFKASYDKANRTSIKGKRGKGLHRTLEEFRTLKLEMKELKILTDVHDIKQIKTITEYFNEYIDVLQIPAFLCRQTDLILAACKTNKIINIKKGQFLAPWDIKGILSKTKAAKEVWITERGTSFGYNTLVTDFTGIQYMRNNFSVPVVFDVTHSVQKPGGQGDSSGGNRSYVPALANAAAGMGVDNFFLEVHPDPDNAPSDGPNMLKLEDFAETIRQIYFINKTVKGFQ